MDASRKSSSSPQFPIPFNSTSSSTEEQAKLASILANVTVKSYTEYELSLKNQEIFLSTKLAILDDNITDSKKRIEADKKIARTNDQKQLMKNKEYEYLLNHNDKSIKIIDPLSANGKNYRAKIIELGQEDAELNRKIISTEQKYLEFQELTKQIKNNEMILNKLQNLDDPTVDENLIKENMELKLREFREEEKIQKLIITRKKNFTIEKTEQTNLLQQIQNKQQRQTEILNKLKAHKELILQEENEFLHSVAELENSLVKVIEENQIFINKLKSANEALKDYEEKKKLLDLNNKEMENELEDASLNLNIQKKETEQNMLESQLIIENLKEEQRRIDEEIQQNDKRYTEFLNELEKITNDSNQLQQKELDLKKMLAEKNSDLSVQESLATDQQKKIDKLKIDINVTKSEYEALQLATDGIVNNITKLEDEINRWMRLQEQNLKYESDERNRLSKLTEQVSYNKAVAELKEACKKQSLDKIQILKRQIHAWNNKIAAIKENNAKSAVLKNKPIDLKLNVSASNIARPKSPGILKFPNDKISTPNKKVTFKGLPPISDSSNCSLSQTTQNKEDMQKQAQEWIKRRGAKRSLEL